VFNISLRKKGVKHGGGKDTTASPQEPWQIDYVLAVAFKETNVYTTGLRLKRACR
jgi:hypothetical protein